MSTAPDQKKLLSTILYASGVFFIAAGSFFVYQPAFLSEMLGMDSEITMIIAAALIFIGVSDFFIARFIFSGSERK